MLIPAARVERLLAAVDRVWAEHLAAGGSCDFLRLFGFPDQDPEFLELLDLPATLRIVCAVLGWNSFLYHSHLDVNPRLQP
ncbi:MAG: hypothetical protein ACRDZ4_02170 [Egibacteraceae bacterium]